MKRLLPVLAFTSLSAMLLIGCGSCRPDPEEVITKAQLAIEEVETYRGTFSLSIRQR